MGVLLKSRFIEMYTSLMKRSCGYLTQVEVVVKQQTKKESTDIIINI